MSFDYEKARIGNSQFYLARCVLYAGDPSFVIKYGVDYIAGLYEGGEKWYLIVFDEGIDTIDVLEQDEEDERILYYRYKDDEDDKYDVYAVFEIQENVNRENEDRKDFFT